MTTYNIDPTEAGLPPSLSQEKQKKDAEAAATGKAIKQTAGELRLQKDISELDLPRGVSIRFPEGEDKIMKFEITLKPDEGLYKYVVPF